MKLRSLILTTALSALALTSACAGAKTAVKGVTLAGDHLELDEHVNFETGKADIKAESHDLLDRVAMVLKASPDLAEVHVHGHTDATGDAAFNKKLSEDRAAAVVKYLEGAGVGAKLVPAGMGQEAPLCTEDTEDCHAKNRRVEFLVKKM